MRELVLDTETTGLDPKSGDRIVEIGIVELINMVPTGKTYHVFINPLRSMPQAAFNVHGLSDEFLADKPKFKDIANDFLTFIGDDSQLVIHNAQFDMGFINMEIGRLSHPPIAEIRVIDTLMLARQRYPLGPNSLDALCSRYGIDNSRRTKHGALLDAELLADVYIELRGGRQTRLTFDDAKEKTTKDSQTNSHPARLRPQPLASRLTTDDLEKHKQFVTNLGDKALWKNYLTN